MAKPYRTTIDDVPLERGLREDEGWVDMQGSMSERRALASWWSGAPCCRRGRATSATGIRTATSSSL